MTTTKTKAWLRAERAAGHASSTALPQATTAYPSPPGDANRVDPVRLEDRARHQCAWPLWDHHATRGDAHYGLMCGAQIVGGGHGQPYCADHHRLNRMRAQHATRIERCVRTTVHGARAAGVA